MTAPAARPPAPWGLIGIAVLLLLLILATPGLLVGAGEPAAGSPAAEAVLWIDVTPGNVTHFYVEGVAHPRYAEIRLATSALPDWPFMGRAGELPWGNWTNASDVVVLAMTSDENPVAVNVTVVFVDASGAIGDYVGLYGLFTSDSTVHIEPMLSGLDPGTNAYPVGALPEALPLLASPVGAP